MTEDIREWLGTKGFGRFADLFEENEIDAEALPELTDQHLKELGIALGPRVKLLKAIQQLREAGSSTEESTPKVGPAPEPARRQSSEAERRHTRFGNPARLEPRRSGSGHAADGCIRQASALLGQAGPGAAGL